MSVTLRISIAVAGSVIIAGIVGLLAWGLLNKSSVTGLSGITRVGQPAPDFSMELIRDGNISLSEQRGSVVVINFWASSCPPCRTEARDLEAAWRNYRDRDVVFIGANIQDRAEPAERFLDEFGVTYPNGLDEGGRISIDYGVVGIPVTFVVDGEGTVARRWVGEIDPERLTTWIDELLEGTASDGETEGVNEDSYYTLDEL